MDPADLSDNFPYLKKLPIEELSFKQRRALVFLALLLSTVISLTLSFVLRFDFTIPGSEKSNILFGLLLFAPIKLGIFYLLFLERGWWMSLGITDLMRIVSANVAASAVTTLAGLTVIGPGFPRSVYALDFLLNTAAICAMRVTLRIHRDLPLKRVPQRRRTPVLIYGAGWAGVGLLREIWANEKLGLRVMGFIDDSPEKQHETVLGVSVLGTGADAERVVADFRDRDIEIGRILIAMPSATARQMRAAIGYCRAAGVVCKTLPSLTDLLANKDLNRQVRDISVEDLLCREPVDLDEADIRASISGQTVLITGAAGSIGSELARQIAAFNPSRLIVLDRAESDLFRIDLELRSAYPSLGIACEICDICDTDDLEEVFARYGIDSIFHAAAYKHVPLMELHPLNAIQNNVCGTWNVVKAAYANKVRSFVLISSDKAVNPTNIMGATKRVAELMVSSFPEARQEEGTRFVAVRFGNVLASNGSVVPIFQQQIAAGGPITVTHPEVQRYFMTIREAAQLVLQASTMGHGGEVFILDMGEPVRIVDLARNMVRLAGLQPDDDIEIRFTGLRPGEKLFEEIMTAGEHILPTRHQKIKIFQGRPISAQRMNQWMMTARALLAERDEKGLIQHMATLIPEYTISPMWQQRLSERARYFEQTV
jgi:FlaA1/EpsC-like NDP-sugar epimerase